MDSDQDGVDASQQELLPAPTTTTTTTVSRSTLGNQTTSRRRRMSESESDAETAETSLRRVKRERTRRRTHNTHSQDDDGDEEDDDNEEREDIDSDDPDENEDNDDYDDTADYDSDGTPIRYERDLATQPTPLQTRRLRSQYRALLSSAADTSALSEHDLISTLHAANKLYRKVKTTQEATLDSRVLVMAADAGVRRVERMRVDGGIFGVEDWLSRVKKMLTVGSTLSNTPPTTSTTRVNDDDDDETILDWYKLGTLATRVLKRAPTIGFMLGPLALEHRPRTGTRRVARLHKDTTALQRPALLTHSDLSSRPETSSLVQTIYTALLSYTTTHPSTPLPLFKFFINPQSFSQSVENMFYTSFLIRDGRAQVVVEEDGELVIEPAAAVQDGDDAAGRRQCLMDLDMDVWRRLVEVYHIEESVIPTRQRVVQEAGKWYG
ncbi:nuclear protein [Gaertneriomyces sp. JEL0708]|nr:nuclear protein [Gaertneriomyces sp. JEL0708]